MSHFKYNEWWDKVEIGIHSPQWSPQAHFWVMDREILGLGSPHFISELWLIGQVDASHSSWTVPMSHVKYNEWWDKVEIGIHSLQWSPQAHFWVMDREILGLGSADFTAELWTIGQVDASHSSWTVPMSHFKYNEWWDKVEIGIHSLQWSPQAQFWVMGGEIFSLRSPHFTAELCMFRQVDASLSSWTVPMSYFKYNEWWDKVEIGIHSLQWSPQARFWVMGGEIFSLRSPTFHSWIVHFWTSGCKSQQQDCANVLFQV